jgi:hypothetical protein
VHTEPLTVFGHVAYIPADAKVDSIRFQRARLVTVPTSMEYTTDVHYCDAVLSREPGSSAFCPSSKVASIATAYELTYSYEAPAMQSQDRDQTHFAFRVYFRPEELPVDIRTDIDSRKLGRADTAGYFEIKTARPLQQRLTIDEAQSSFCSGSFIEGSWTKTDSNCDDKIVYKTADSDSASITVTIDPKAAKPAVLTSTR